MQSHKFSTHLAFSLFTLAVMLALVLPNLVQHGMFMDGTQYAIVAKNLWEGKGSFWFPYLSSSWEKQGQNYFLEHPPLIYFLESFFFKICNGSYLSERLYCFFTFILSAFLIKAIWQRIFKKENKYHLLYWLPVLLWIIVPSVSWSYKNNMQENTVSVFVLASVYFMLRSISKDSNTYLFIILAGTSIFLASFSKGLPGLFPLSFFIIMRLAFKNITWKQVISNTFLLALIPAAIYFLMVYFNDDARRSLSFYVNERLFHRISNDPEVESRFTVLFWLFSDLLVPMVILLPFMGFNMMRNKKSMLSLQDPILKKHILLFAGIGLAGVIPLCLTHVQRAVYFVPALPFFAIMLSVLFLDEIFKLQNNVTLSPKAFKTVFTVGSVGVIAVLIYTIIVFGKDGRDEEVISDARKIAVVTGKNKNIYALSGIYEEWGFQFYLLRYNNITLEPGAKQQEYILLNKEEKFADATYKDLNLDLTKYKLLKKIN
ncbi:MAG: glycosyltransferase family 39 protein [Bacteroidia bacterium]|nr:glycosyltransferase family 39 protein [Bacteroidia bacterium]